jgi:hypothetical protein
MRGKQYRLRVGGALGAVALGVGAAGVLTAPTASAVGVSPALIGPHQYFVAQVNGVVEGAAVKVGCVGPVSATAYGHPLAGQTVDVQYAPVAADEVGLGYTGESATHVVVGFESLPVATRAVTISQYGTKVAIPTTLSLPCSGTGTVVFVPGPTSDTALTATIPVTYVGEWEPSGS